MTASICDCVILGETGIIGMSVLPVRSNKPRTRFRLRKVIRRNHLFVCGMCATEYPRRLAAESCLTRCTVHFVQTAAVKEEVTSKGVTAFVCEFCSRRFREEKNARICVEHCRKEVKKMMLMRRKALHRRRTLKREGMTQYEGAIDVREMTFESEFKRPEQSLLKKKRSNLKKRQQEQEAQALTYQKKAQQARAKGLAGANAADLADLTDGEDFAATPAAASKRPLAVVTAEPPDEALDAAATVPEEAAVKDRAPRKNRRDQMYKYGRDGRILFCKKCGGEYKTIDAVIDCYDSHEGEKVERVPKAKEKGYVLESSTYECPKCHSKHSSRKRMLACCQEFASADDDLETGKKEIKLFDAKSDKDKFTRHGSKYVCAACNDKFFTRIEAIGCFDEHVAAAKASAAAEAAASVSAQDEGSDDIDWGAAMAEQTTGRGSESQPEAESVEPAAGADDSEGEIDWGAAMEEQQTGGSESTDLGAADAADDEGAIDWGDALAAQQGAAGSDAPDAAKPGSDETTAYRREGSRYICKNCSSKYFTKVEAETCFKGH